MHFDVVLILIGLTCAISVYAWSNEDLLEKWIMQPYLVQRRGEWYRFLTSGFLHADIGHLAFNMYAFYSFSAVARYYFADAFGPMGGLAIFLLLYLGGIIVSDIPTFLKHRDNPSYRSLGASGGVAAVMFSCIVFQPLGEIGVIFLPGVGIPGFLFGLLYVLFSYYQSRRIAADGVNHDAHLYGAIYGIVLTIILIPGSIADFWHQVSDKYL